MARGWESKSVEQQQAEAADVSAPVRHRVSAEEAAIFRQREDIMLSRRRILHQLEVVRNPQYRIMLERALSDLDARLTQLG
jgi:hypothetical protein